jgi:trans-aconitate 2-methyltransferase
MMNLIRNRLLLVAETAIFPYVSVDWNATSYHRISGPMEEMGLAVLERLALRGDETVLDAGCGTGRVTAALCERLPRGRVIAVDRAPSMVEQARSFLAGRADVREADLLTLDVGERVDAIFSTVTFHHILDHVLLFSRLFAALAPGGRLVAQCGGAGNVAETFAAAEELAAAEPFAPSFRGWGRPHYFATPDETASRLETTGFTEVRCWLSGETVQPEDPAEYLSTIVLRSHVSRLPEELAPLFLAAVVERVGDPFVLEYVRLNIDARRPG